jgi:hypothetical protein
MNMKLFYEVMMTLVLALLLGLVTGYFKLTSEFVLVSLVIITSFPGGIFIVVSSDYFFGRCNERDK